MKYEPKPLFTERMLKLFGGDSEEYERYLKISEIPMRRSVRCNTLKITPEELKIKLERRGWKIEQSFPEAPEVMVVVSGLKPGELGNSIEHMLGYYYVQELSSLMPALALKPAPGDMVLDLAAAPGSKTTQMAAMMKNQGTLIANDKDINRISVLSTNLERCGVTNAIVTRHDGVQLCEKLEKIGIRFDKILLDLPCSGEGNIRSSPKTLLMWNIRMIEKLARLQRKLAVTAVKLLKENGKIIYSTCTHSPEENEANVNFLSREFNLEIEKIVLPVKCRQGVKNWEKEEFSAGIENCCRIYPQDNDTEGFFLARMRRRK
ncbi:MAG: RsmB/NOP family class I SAM-dependent RNA methyltransferase [Nanoarchaeota archaeon]